MTKEAFRIVDNTIASIIEPSRKETIRQDLRSLILDLERKFKSVLQLKEKYADADDCRETDEAVAVDLSRAGVLRRPTIHATFSLPPRSRDLFVHGQSHYELLARRHYDRQQALLVHDNNNDDDDDSSFCSMDSTKVRCGKKRTQRVRGTAEAKEECRTVEMTHKLDFVQSSPVDTIIPWSLGEDDEPPCWLVVEDDDDKRCKRRCSSFF